MSHELILHHYDFSNYSEKVRLVLGLKGLDWRSVDVPAIAPKPDFTPLTGGYRRAPALQIGADVYCDTWLIIEHLERLKPSPTIHPGDDRDAARAHNNMLTAWAENNLQRSLALFITGLHAEDFAPEFHADRARLHGKPQPQVAQVKAAAEKYRQQVDIQLSWIDDLLRSATPFLGGDEVSLADISLYQAPWFLQVIAGADAVPEKYPRLREWAGRVAATGHGGRQELAASDALSIAAQAKPKEITEQAEAMPVGVALGDRVSVSPFDQASPAVGQLISMTPQSVSLLTEDPLVGTLHVHFPRLGYRIKRVTQ